MFNGPLWFNGCLCKHKIDINKFDNVYIQVKFIVKTLEAIMMI